MLAAATASRQTGARLLSRRRIAAECTWIKRLIYENLHSDHYFCRAGLNAASFELNVYSVLNCPGSCRQIQIRASNIDPGIWIVFTYFLLIYLNFVLITRLCVPSSTQLKPTFQIKKKNLKIKWKTRSSNEKQPFRF